MSNAKETPTKEIPAQVRVISPNMFTVCWYNNHVGEVFTVLHTRERFDGHLQYAVGIRHLNRTIKEGSFEYLREGFIIGFIDEVDAEIVSP